MLCVQVKALKSFMVQRGNAPEIENAAFAHHVDSPLLARLSFVDICEQAGEILRDVDDDAGDSNGAAGQVAVLEEDLALEEMAPALAHHQQQGPCRLWTRGRALLCLSPLHSAGDLDLAIRYQIFLRADGTPDERELYRAALNIVLAVLVLRREHGRIHADIKPANILAMDDPHTGATCANDPRALLRLADLEHACVPDRDTGMVVGPLGTEEWRAPEVLAQQGSTPASDMYSLSATLRELFRQRLRTCVPFSNVVILARV